VIGVGVIGYGYWGPNLVRNLAENTSIRVIAVSDLRAERLEIVKRRFPTIDTQSNALDVIDDPRVDAVVIATPLATHYELAKRALEAGKHVLVSKPMVGSLDQGRELVAEAARRRLTLMVDHTFVYTPAIRLIQKLTADGTLGRIYYYDSVRVNLGLFQHDVNVVWDLAVHDLSIMDYVLPQKPLAVAATGVRHIAGEPENIAYLTVYYPNDLISHVHVNWLAPVKVRLTLLGGSNRMIVYDDLQVVEKVKVYDRGVTVTDSSEQMYEMLVSYRTGDMWSPRLDGTEALHSEIQHFVQCIESGEEPITGGRAGVRTVAVLEAASRSMANRGAAVELAEESW
jgi:predicted dehydrogenase